MGGVKGAWGAGFYEEKTARERVEDAPEPEARKRSPPRLKSDPLTPGEVVAARRYLGLTQVQLSAIIGVKIRGIKAWERRERDSESRNCSGAARRLLMLLVVHPELVEELRDQSSS